LGTYLCKTAPENPPIPLNSLFPVRFLMILMKIGLKHWINSFVSWSGMTCEVIRLDCDLLLMATVNVSSRVRTIAYRMYPTPVRYSIHYLCNVNNTPSSDSWCCFSLTPSSRYESEAGFKIEKNLDFRIPTLRFQVRNIWNTYLRTKSCLKILKKQFRSCPPRDLVDRVKQ
jgi:hypothetical protein